MATFHRYTFDCWVDPAVNLLLLKSSSSSKLIHLFQTYYCEYYARYLEEYEKYGAQMSGRPDEEPIEISILMGDLVSLS